MPKAGGKSALTPDLQMQLLKKLVTAGLALIIIIVTVIFAVRSFAFVGDTGKVHDAKDLLTIMLGLSGVVVGYYFGRVPAEARANQATARADAAVSQHADLKARTRSIASQMDSVISESTPAMTTDPQSAQNISKLRSLGDNLNDLSGPTMS